MRPLACVVALWMVSIASSAAAQNLDLERSTPPLDADGFLAMQGSTTPGPGLWNVNFGLGWQYRQLMLNTPSGEHLEAVTDRVTTTLGFQVGIGGRLALGIAAPFVAWQSGPGAWIDSRPLPTGAVGDPRVSLRYRILGESAGLQRERNEGPGLALQVTSTVPVGQTDAFFGEGATRMSAQLVGDFHVLNAAVGAMLGYRHRFESRSYLNREFGDEIEFGAAIQLPLLLMRDFVGIAEFHAITDTRAFFDRPTTSGEFLLGARIKLGDVYFTSAFGTGLLPGVGTPVVRTTFEITWAPRVHDLDQDGLPDDADECPPLAEDRDGFEDEDGCPDPDNDNDFIPDEDDRCPAESAEEGRDENEDGCTDPLPEGDAAPVNSEPAPEPPA